MKRRTLLAISEFVSNTELDSSVIVGFDHQRAFIVTFDDSIQKPEVQSELAGILYRWVNSMAISCPLEFAERVHREIEDGAA